MLVVLLLAFVLAATPSGSEERSSALPGAPDLDPKLAEGLRLQILLARTAFQPGEIDGRPGSNTSDALRGFQRAVGLPVTGRADPTTLATLEEVAEVKRRPLLREVELTEAQVGGPFGPAAKDVYAAHELDCLCYTSKAEELGERFHASPKLLAALNPGVDLAEVEAGDTLVVPDTPSLAPMREVAKIRIDVATRTLSAYDAGGALVREYPTVVGDTFRAYRGDMKVVGVAMDPDYRLDPDTWEEIPDRLPAVTLKPGPNSPVGTVWIDLSEDGFGIHGTNTPGLVGHTQSHGCVRLTNWAAEELSAWVEPGTTTVEFVGLEQG